jgi:hypothetical protein
MFSGESEELIINDDNDIGNKSKKRNLIMGLFADERSVIVPSEY